MDIYVSCYPLQGTEGFMLRYPHSLFQITGCRWRKGGRAGRTQAGKLLRLQGQTRGSMSYCQGHELELCLCL